MQCVNIFRLPSIKEEKDKEQSLRKEKKEHAQEYSNLWNSSKHTDQTMSFFVIPEMPSKTFVMVYKKKLPAHFKYTTFL